MRQLPSLDKPWTATSSSSASSSFSSSAESDWSSHMPTNEKLFQCAVFQMALQDSRLEPLTIQLSWRVIKVVKAVRISLQSTPALSLIGLQRTRWKLRFEEIRVFGMRGRTTSVRYLLIDQKNDHTFFLCVSFPLKEIWSYYSQLK